MWPVNLSAIDGKNHNIASVPLLGQWCSTWLSSNSDSAQHRSKRKLLPENSISSESVLHQFNDYMNFGYSNTADLSLLVKYNTAFTVIKYYINKDVFDYCKGN